MLQCGRVAQLRLGTWMLLAPGGVGALLGTNVTVSVLPGGRPGPETGVVAVPRGCIQDTKEVRGMSV